MGGNMLDFLDLTAGRAAGIEGRHYAEMRTRRQDLSTPPKVCALIRLAPTGAVKLNR
jgi:hypothetical protein